MSYTYREEEIRVAQERLKNASNALERAIEELQRQNILLRNLVERKRKQHEQTDCSQD